MMCLSFDYEELLYYYIYETFWFRFYILPSQIFYSLNIEFILMYIVKKNVPHPSLERGYDLYVIYGNVAMFGFHNPLFV